ERARDARRRAERAALVLEGDALALLRAPRVEEEDLRVRVAPRDSDAVADVHVPRPVGARRVEPLPHAEAHARALGGRLAAVDRDRRARTGADPRVAEARDRVPEPEGVR